jgi:hypothetical protein
MAMANTLAYYVKATIRLVKFSLYRLLRLILIIKKKFRSQWVNLTCYIAFA